MHYCETFVNGNLGPGLNFLLVAGVNLWNNVGMKTKQAGRPKLPRCIKKSESIRVRLDEGLKNSLERLALAYSLDVSDIARMAFASYIARNDRPMLPT